MRHMLYAMGKRDTGSDAPVKVSLPFALDIAGERLRGKISYSPHAAGTDRGNPRDAGEVYACQGSLCYFSSRERGCENAAPFLITTHPAHSHENR